MVHISAIPLNWRLWSAKETTVATSVSFPLQGRVWASGLPDAPFLCRKSGTASRNFLNPRTRITQLGLLLRPFERSRGSPHSGSPHVHGHTINAPAPRCGRQSATQGTSTQLRPRAAASRNAPMGQVPATWYPVSGTAYGINHRLSRDSQEGLRTRSTD